MFAILKNTPLLLGASDALIEAELSLREEVLVIGTDGEVGEEDRLVLGLSQ